MKKIEIKSADELKAHIIANQFSWYKDGETKSSDYIFFGDGTYCSSTSSKTNGRWKVLDANTFWFANGYGHEYTLKFQDKYG